MPNQPAYQHNSAQATTQLAAALHDIGSVLDGARAARRALGETINDLDRVRARLASTLDAERSTEGYAGTANRMLDLIRDAIGREPAMWPTASQYRDQAHEHGQAAFNRSLSGVQADDGSWVAVFTAPWRALCAENRIDSAISLRELHNSGHLRIADSRRRRGEWLSETTRRLTGTSMYQLTLPPSSKGT